MATARATIKRGSRPSPSRARKAAPKKPALFARAIAILPVRQETVQRTVTWGTLGLGAALVMVLAAEP